MSRVRYGDRPDRPFVLAKRYNPARLRPKTSKCLRESLMHPTDSGARRGRSKIGGQFGRRRIVRCPSREDPPFLQGRSLLAGHPPAALEAGIGLAGGVLPPTQFGVPL